MRAKTATFSPLRTSRCTSPVAISAFWRPSGMPWRMPRTTPSRTAACGGESAASSAAASVAGHVKARGLELDVDVPLGKVGTAIEIGQVAGQHELAGGLDLVA